MKTKACRWTIVTVALLIAVIAIGWVTYLTRGVSPVSEKEEIAVATALLAEKLSGPRYFNAPVPGISEEGGPWIDVADAESQLARIAAERKLRPEAIRELEQLIVKLTESHPSRIVGGKRINLPRLNLSLDSIKE